MKPEFWHRKWESKQIGFHEPAGNALLIKWFDELKLNSDQRVFVPLCGKTLDIACFLSQGCRVAGAELSEIAIQELFDDLKISPVVTEIGALKTYSGPNIDIFVGDFFQLTGEMLGEVEVVYDRAALVAMPDSMRRGYCEQLTKVTNRAPQLLISFEYDQELMNGPPFSVTGDEITSLYGEVYQVKCLESVEIPRGFKTLNSAQERIWILR